MAVNDSSISFNEWLRVTLRNRDIVASDLARQIDVDPSTVSRWMNGERTPGWDLCVRLAITLRVDVARLAVTAALLPPEAAQSAGVELLPIRPAATPLRKQRERIEALKYVTAKQRRRMVEILEDAHAEGRV